jgi:putative (di)nucleoside polyphosphate hydrolase
MSKQTVSCGTLVVDADHRLLLCHVTHTDKWDIPKGMLDPGESPLEAAMRELYEEAGISFPPERFEDLGLFDYRRDKRLHLFKVDSGIELGSLDHLVCTSFFPHHVTGKATPEMDGYCWVTRDEVPRMCWPRMGALLMRLEW